MFTDMREMLKLQELDAVSVCTWNSAHAPCAIAALNAGKHVLCEKPMALNAREAAEMQAAAERAGKLLMIGFVRRFGNDCFTAQDFLDTGYCGEIYYAKAVYQLSLIHILFLAMWDDIRGIQEDYEKFKPQVYQTVPEAKDGFVQPYSDNPLDDEIVGETVYFNLINKAKRYVYITCLLYTSLRMKASALYYI